MKWMLALFALVAVACALPTKELSHAEMADFINKQEGLTWTAKAHPRFSKMSLDEMSRLMGARKRSENPRSHLFKPQPKAKINPNDIPKEFDARTKWPQCADVIGTIADQSSCGSCWAVSSASAMSDRLCIASNGADKTPVSAIDLVGCCFSCGYGCDGGWPDEAFHTWARNGIVSGSGYTVDQGCKPYPFAECEHHSNKTTYKPCPKDIYSTPKCLKSCQQSYKTHTYQKDKVYGKDAVVLSRDVLAIQNEIMTNGPVVFSFDVYADFMAYGGGVYQHKTGKKLGGHAVRAIGWGEENGTKYWLIANSWNADWGENGFFRMIRGVDNCRIEEEVSAGLAKSP